MNLSIATYAPSGNQRPLGSASAPGTIDMTRVDADNQVKQQIVDTVFPLSSRRGTPGFNASALQVLWDALNNGYIREYYAADEVAADCSKASSSTRQQILATATRVGETAINLGLKAIKAAPIIGAIIDTALNIFTAITQHHAQAVQQEQTILCMITPAINNAIQGLDNAVASGQITLQDALQGLQALQNGYEQNVIPIIKNSSTACNAACVIDRGFVALFMYKAYQYQKYVAASPVATVQNTIAETANSVGSQIGNALGLTNSPTLGAQPNTILIYAVLAIGLFLLVRK